MYPLIVKYTTYPVHNFVQRLKGYKTEKYHKEMMESQWFIPSQLEELQQEKLRVLLEHAYKNVPYYRKVFDNLGLKPKDIQDKEDLTRLPLLRKEDIIKNPSTLIAKNISKKELMPMTTSGTTGSPLKLFKDKNEVAYKAAARHRQQKIFGFKHGDKVVSIRGHSFSRKRKFQGLFTRIVRNEWIPYGYDTSEAKVGKLVEKIREYNPKFIRGYPSSIYLLAKYMENNGIEDLQPESVWLGYEIGFNFQRKLIEEQFNCKVFDVFGLRESAIYAFECNEHAGYHLASENGIIEILRKDGSHASSGELGAVAFTDFTNFATPLIRYLTEDVAIYSGKLCPCGRGLPVIIKSVEGRFSDCISTSKGYVLPGIIVDFFSKIETIKDFQVIQKTRERIVAEVVREENYSINNTDFVISGMQKLVGSDVNIEVEYVDSVPLTTSGKKRFVISEAPPKFVSDEI